MYLTKILPISVTPSFHADHLGQIASTKQVLNQVLDKKIAEHVLGFLYNQDAIHQSEMWHAMMKLSLNREVKPYSESPFKSTEVDTDILFIDGNHTEN